MITEIDFYLSLFDEFLIVQNNDQEKIFWKLNAIIKLMQTAETLKGDGDFCENGLRMIMSLFNNYTSNSYEFNSKKFNPTSEIEKEIVLPILKHEFAVI